MMLRVHLIGSRSTGQHRTRGSWPLSFPGMRSNLRPHTSGGISLGEGEVSPVMGDPYIRAVSNIEVIDGDTFHADVDLGFHVWVRMSCRIVGINAPEHDQPGGPEATSALALILGRGAVTVTSVSADKYAGRFDAHVTVIAAKARNRPAQSWDVGTELVAQGHAAPWDGKGTRPTVPWPPAERN